MTEALTTTWPPDVQTLAIDIGGSGVKGSLLDANGRMVTERVRFETPYPCPPHVLLATIGRLVKALPKAQRVSVGFPGLVRDGVVVNVPAFSKAQYGGEIDAHLVAKWHGYNLGSAIADLFDAPTKVVNDADMQACAVVKGTGFEFVMTLGTGVGTALFYNGRLLPHLEMGHTPFRNNETFEQQLGNVARKAVGNKAWVKRVLRALPVYRQFLFYDKIYVGGGNAKHLPVAELPDYAVVVPNTAGITGGVRVWTFAD